MIISKLRKEITDELTTMESHFGDMDIKELSLVDRSMISVICGGMPSICMKRILSDLDKVLYIW